MRADDVKHDDAISVEDSTIWRNCTFHGNKMSGNMKCFARKANVGGCSGSVALVYPTAIRLSVTSLSSPSTQADDEEVVNQNNVKVRGSIMKSENERNSPTTAHEF